MSETSKLIFGDQIIIRNGAEHDGEPGTIIDHTHGYFKVAPEVAMIQVHRDYVEPLPGDDAPDEIKVGSEVIYNGFDTRGKNVRAMVEEIGFMNGRQLATIRLGQQKLRIYTEELTPAAPITLTTREEMDIRVAAYSAKNAPDSTEDTALKLVVVQAELIRRYEKRMDELAAALTPFANAWENRVAGGKLLREDHYLTFGLNYDFVYLSDNAGSDDSIAPKLKGEHLEAAADALNGKQS